MILLNPGPVNASARVRAALTLPDMCHREPEYFLLQDAIRGRLLDVLDAPADKYAAVLLSGSGTAAVEAMIASAVPQQGRLLVVRNGSYGDRMALMARTHGIAFDILETPWTERPSMEQLGGMLARTRYDCLAIVHHETTTGLLNDLGPVSALCRQYRVRLLVDAVSSIGGEELDLRALRAAAVCGSANKCLQGMPGAAFVVVDREFVHEMAGYGARTVYLHIPRHFAAQESGSTAFTPAIQVYSALLAALEELASETIGQRASRFARASSIVRDGLEAIGLELYLPSPLRSRTLTAIRLPQGLSYAELHDALKAEGFVIYAGQGPEEAGLFRVATMGVVPEEEYRRFVQSVGRVVEHGPVLGHPERCI